MRRNWQLTLLLGLFLMPLLSALYLLGSQTYDFKTVEFGKLIANPKPLKFTKLYQLDGEEITSLTTNKKWHLIYVAANICTDECQQRKKILANLQIALGPNQNRLQILTGNREQIKVKPDDGSILLLNPDGLYIMHYPSDANASNVLKDIKRLLKYSHD